MRVSLGRGVSVGGTVFVIVRVAVGMRVSEDCGVRVTVTEGVGVGDLPIVVLGRGVIVGPETVNRVETFQVKPINNCTS